MVRVSYTKGGIPSRGGSSCKGGSSYRDATKAYRNYKKEKEKQQKNSKRSRFVEVNIVYVYDIKQTFTIPNLLLFKPFLRDVYQRSLMSRMGKRTKVVSPLDTEINKEKSFKRVTVTESQYDDKGKVLKTIQISCNAYPLAEADYPVKLNAAVLDSLFEKRDGGYDDSCASDSDDEEIKTITKTFSLSDLI